jgi:hypothetical protein
MVTTSWLQQQLAHTVLAKCWCCLVVPSPFGDTVVPLHVSQLWLTAATVPSSYSCGQCVRYSTACGSHSKHCCQHFELTHRGVGLPHVQNETDSRVPAGDCGRRARYAPRHSLPSLAHLPPPECRCTCPETIGFRFEPRRLEMPGADRPPLRMLNSS